MKFKVPAAMPAPPQISSFRARECQASPRATAGSEGERPAQTRQDRRKGPRPNSAYRVFSPSLNRVFSTIRARSASEGRANPSHDAIRTRGPRGAAQPRHRLTEACKSWMIRAQARCSLLNVGRRGAGVADRAGFENQCAGNRTGGSNPLSALLLVSSGLSTTLPLTGLAARRNCFAQTTSSCHTQRPIRT